MRVRRPQPATPAATRAACLRLLIVLLSVVAAIVLIAFLLSWTSTYSPPSTSADSSSTATREAAIPRERDDVDDSVNRHTGGGMFSGNEALHLCDGKIIFPRERIVVTHDGGPACEGYFAPLLQSAKDGDASTGSPLPMPVKKKFPFCGLMEWSRRLHAIERLAMHEEQFDTPPSGISVQRQRGLTQSRITGQLLGNQEFTDRFAFTDAFLERHPEVQKANGGPGKIATGEAAKAARDIAQPGDVVCWTGDYRGHYVTAHNVVPSEEFYHYVLDRYESLSEHPAHSD